MQVFPVRVEHALDVTVQRPHDADARMHQRSATFRRHDQAGELAASLSVTIWRPRGSEIGSSNGRFQPRSGTRHQDLLDYSVIEFHAFGQRLRKVQDRHAVLF